MNKIVTIQDIANALDLSRNTVSKALNNRSVPEKTKKAVIEKAIEMGYKGFNQQLHDQILPENLNVMLTTSKPNTNIHFFLELIRGIEEITADRNIQLIQYNHFPFDDKTENLKRAVENHNISAVICFDTFDSDSIDSLLSLNIPAVFIDFSVDDQYNDFSFDVVTMNSLTSVSKLCDQLITEHELRTIGFVGDHLHCRSFYDRFLGMHDALIKNGLEYSNRYSLLEDDTFPYGNIDKLAEALNNVELPQLFICANDFLAMSLVQALKKKGITVPDDVLVTGFDNIFEAETFSPQLTTINVNKRELGRQAISILLDRIKKPNTIKRTITLPTHSISRASAPMPGALK